MIVTEVAAEWRREDRVWGHTRAQQTLRPRRQDWGPFKSKKWEGQVHAKSGARRQHRKNESSCLHVTCSRISSWLAWTWRRRRYDPSKPRELFAHQHIVSSQKKWISSFEYLFTSNL